MIQQVFVVNQSSGGTENQGNSNLDPTQGWVVQFTDGVNLITAGDNANNSLRVTLVNSGVTQDINITEIAGVAVAVAAAGIMKVGIADSAGNAINNGQQLMASSMPVVLASDQSDVGINVDKYGGTATTLGQKLMAASMPVVLASDQSAIPVTSSGTGGTLTDRSGTITTGGTSQTLMAANASRKYLFIQNVSTADLWFNFGVAAVTSQPSIRLSTGDSFVMESNFVSTQAINIIGATTSQAFSSKEG